MLADDDSTKLLAHNRLAERVVYVAHVETAGESLGSYNGSTLISDRLRIAVERQQQ